MALRSVETRDDGFKLAVWEITETEEELRFLCTTSDIEREELSRIRSAKRRKERLAVGALLCEMFGEYTRVEHDDKGCPFFSNRTEKLSIAHTQRFAVVCIHPQKRVGVDIESLERDFSAVESRAISNLEKTSLCHQKRSLHLAIIWSAKEALYKCVSQEDVDFAQQIEIEPFVPQESGTLSARFYSKSKSSIHFFLEYKIIDNHILVYMCT